MPVTWGQSPAQCSDVYVGNDIRQFTKFFDLHGMDFEMRRISGLWEVCAWTADGADVFSITAKHESLEEALISCYSLTREQLRAAAPGFGDNDYL